MTHPFLAYTQRILDDRARQYGLPENTLARIAKRWSLTLECDITPQQVALCMLDVKLVRLAHDPGHRDSIVDLAGYAACLYDINRYQEEGNDETRA